MPAYSDPTRQLAHVRDLLAKLPAEKLGEVADKVTAAVDAIDSLGAHQRALHALNTQALISVDQYAALIGVNRQTAYAHVRDGQVHTVNVGRRVRVASAPVRRLLGLDEAAAGA